MKSLADHITSELSVLIGQPIGDCWRVANMQIFEFGPRVQKRDRKGEMIEVSDISLRIQCRWRFLDVRSILFGREGMSVGTSNGYFRAMRTFCRWMLRARRAGQDPLVGA